MTIPDDPAVAGWYRYGARPGNGRGSIVLAAHLDSDHAPGPWAALTRLRPGDDIIIVSSPTSSPTSKSATRIQGLRPTSRTYRVTTIDRQPKKDLDLATVFTRTGPERLHLMTCAGRFDRTTGHYEDNLIATATPVSTTRPARHPRQATIVTP